jgi:cytochrome c biogenesis protein CcmG/thiol:disulfide interchange protein DsbE
VRSNKRIIAIVGGVVLLVVMVFVIALVATGGDDSDDADDGATAATAQGASTDGTGASTAGGETAPVAVSGDVLAPFVPNSDDVAVGVAAPQLDGQSFDGSAVAIGGPSENATMVVFLAHWCPHCNAEVPRLIELDDGGDLPAGLDVVGVSTAADQSAPNYPPSEWMADNDWPWPAMADSDDLTALQAYGGTGFPFLVILDADGNVVARKSGESPTTAELGDWINSTLA